MWQNIRSPLMFLSIGMNIAFLIVLALLWWPGFTLESNPDRPDVRNAHRESSKPRDPPNTTDKKDPGWYFYTHKIGVSDTQWKQLRPDMEAFHGKAYELCLKIRRLRNDVLHLIEAPESNTGSIREKQQRIMDLKMKKHRMFVDYMTEKKQFLTPEQEKRFFGILRGGRDCDKHTRFLENKGHK